MTLLVFSRETVLFLDFTVSLVTLEKRGTKASFCSGKVSPKKLKA